MQLEEEYRLSEYQDLGPLEEKEHIRLKRNKIYGYIRVEKHVSAELVDIYQFLKENPSPYIPRICECIPEKDCLIIIEEYVEGRTLEEILSERCMEESEAAAILMELGKALKILHHASPPIICRDLKAANVMVSNAGEVKIVDFNISRLYQKGKNQDTALLGTRGYAAPEQFGYFQTDNRTDIYALGVLVNYMVSGRFPTEGISKGMLEPVIRKCICMDPKDRYQTVEELMRHLMQICPRCGGEEPESYAAEEAEGYALPGFRSRTLWKGIVAVTGYLFLAYLCFSVEITREGVPLAGIQLRMEQSVFWISQMVWIGIVCDYRGLRRQFPMLACLDKRLRFVMYLVIEACLIMIAAFLCVLGEMFFQV